MIDAFYTEMVNWWVIAAYEILQAPDQWNELYLSDKTSNRFLGSIGTKPSGLIYNAGRNGKTCLPVLRIPARPRFSARQVSPQME